MTRGGPTGVEHSRVVGGLTYDGVSIVYGRKETLVGSGDVAIDGDDRPCRWPGGENSQEFVMSCGQILSTAAAALQLCCLLMSRVIGGRGTPFKPVHNVIAITDQRGLDKLSADLSRKLMHRVDERQSAEVLRHDHIVTGT